MDYASSILGFLPGGRRSTGISQLFRQTRSLFVACLKSERVAPKPMNSARKGSTAARSACRAKPYITPPGSAVADILADLRLDADTLVAAILHDVIEDTPTAKAEIASIFGQVVSRAGRTAVSKLESDTVQESPRGSSRELPQNGCWAMVARYPRHHGPRLAGPHGTTCAPSEVMPPVKADAGSARENLGNLRADRPSASGFTRSSSN